MTNFEDKDTIKNQELEQDVNLIDESYDLYDDPPRGWSYICLSETISYYTNHTMKKKAI